MSVTPSYPYYSTYPTPQLIDNDAPGTGVAYITITFLANLSPPGPGVIMDYQNQFKTAYLPGVGRLTQGDTITLHGDAAVYARKTYTSGVVGDYLSYPLQIVSVV